LSCFEYARAIPSGWRGQCGKLKWSLRVIIPAADHRLISPAIEVPSILSY